MTTTSHDLEPRWARLGALLNCAPSDSPPDIERTLIDTADRCQGNARIAPIAVTWLVYYGPCVARHRLTALAQRHLQGIQSAALGLIIESALEHGAPPLLRRVLDACKPVSSPLPLFTGQRGNAVLEGIAQRNASKLSRRWGVWHPEIVLKPDAIRPNTWLLARNPEYADRVKRKGDLRASLIAVLRNDLPGGAIVSELSHRCGATRAGTERALKALTLEGTVVKRSASPKGHRHHYALAA